MLACPDCGAHRWKVVSKGKNLVVECQSCGICGPFAETDKQAISEWNTWAAKLDFREYIGHLMSSKPNLSISAEVVFSSEFTDHAIDLIVKWCQKNDPESGHLDTLLRWQSKEIKSRHLPVAWGSGWACDIPLYLRAVQQHDMPGVIDRLERQNNDEWQRCFRVSEAMRSQKQL